MPRLRFPGFEGEWERKTMRAECSFFSGGTPNSTDAALYNGTIPFIRSAEIDASETALYLSEKGLMSSSAKLVKVGDLLLAMYGANSGEVAISRMNGAINQAILCIRSTSLQPALIKYCLERDKTKITSRYLQGGQGNLSAEIIKELMFYFPQKCEQDKISRFISTIEERIAAQRRLVELLKKHKRGLINLLFKPAEHRGWKTVRLGDVGSFQKGAALSKADISNDGRPFILYGELYTTYGEIIKDVVRRTTAEVDLSYLSRSGDVIMPTSGETSEEIATASCVMSDGVILGGDLNIYRSEHIDGRFLAYVIRYIISRDISRIAQGVSVVHISASELKRISVSIPSSDQQMRIVSVLENYDDRITMANEILKKMEAAKHGLLQQLFV